MAPLRKIFDGAYSTTEVARKLRLARHRIAALVSSGEFVPSEVGHDGSNSRWTEEDVVRLRHSPELMRKLKRPRQAVAP